MLLQGDTNKDFPASTSFGIFGLLTLAFIYAKMTVHLYIRWTYILSPMTLFFTLKFLKSVYKIAQLQSGTVRVIKVKALWNICQLLITATLSVATFYLGELIERQLNEQDIQEPLKHLFACFAFTLVIYLIYSISVSNNEKQTHSTIMNFLLSMFGNTVNVCSGGACNSFYLSTLTAFFSAFGIPIAQYIHYLNYLCVILLAFSLLSLYSVKASAMYAPFIITLIGSLMILTDMFVYDFNYANYFGNALVIGSALWNSKLNKFSFGRRK